MENSKSITTWPAEDRPREKLIKNGSHSLTDTELLAILLRTGVKGCSAIDLAREILSEFKSFRNISRAETDSWRRFKGLGEAKISQIKAAIEIGRRFREEQLKDCRKPVNSARDVVDILSARMRDLNREIFKILLLNSRNHVTEIKEITEGTVNQANPLIREIFHKALQSFAVSIIAVHNHPSGNPLPSNEDRAFTMSMVQAGRILEINVLDHIIIAGDDYYSFAENEEL